MKRLALLLVWPAVTVLMIAATALVFLMWPLFVLFGNIEDSDR